ncbi:MAG: phosphoribosylanthranilate isomerase [Verrucomicrobia bacterium]|nr:phosphoribosylanthranilate isomerase [Verrucomicrobiota bacterium]
MVGDISLKVCGLTTAADAAAAVRVGADYLGYIFYPKSPRYLPLDVYRGLSLGSLAAKRVAVVVEPATAELAELATAGFDFFQLHCRPEVSTETVAGWAETVGVQRLWLAPKLPPGTDYPDRFLPFARTVLFDAFDGDKFGGTGRTSDWGKYTRHRRLWPHIAWILSGGLSPANVADALAQTGASWVDVNSGVESAPGRKDPAKLEALAAAIQARK